MKERLAQILEEYRNGERRLEDSYPDLAALLDDGISAAPHEPNEQA